MERPLSRLLPASHHFARKGKLYMEPRQACQKSETRRTYSLSLRMAVLSFQRPEPGGMMSGTPTETWTPQWSEKGQGTTVHDKTEHTQRKGMPTRSMREVRAAFHLVHVNPGVKGCKYRKMSVTQQASKRTRRGRGTLTGRVGRIRAPPVQSSIKHHVKIPTQ